MQTLVHAHPVLRSPFSFITFARSTSFLCTAPRLMPDTLMLTSGVERKVSSASRDPSVEACVSWLVRGAHQPSAVVLMLLPTLVGKEGKMGSASRDLSFKEGTSVWAH